MTDIDKITARLERKLAREKSARKEAETLLETKSKELYESNQQLQQHCAEVNLQQQQLSFLTGLSADTWMDCTINELTIKFVERAAGFLSKAKAVFIQFTSKGIDKVYISKLIDDHSEQQAITGYCKTLDISSLFSRLHEEESESDLIDLSELTSHQEYQFALFVPIYQLSERVGAAVFFYKHGDDIDVLKFQTIESSRTMLSSAIQRKLGSQSLKKRYGELKAAYEKLDQVKKQLVQSEKMASLGQLAAGVAHEINNPIGYVLSNYQTLNEYLQVVEEMFNYANLLIQSPSASNPLIDQLNQLWRSEDVDFIREDLNQLMTASHKGLIRVQEIVAGLKSFSHADSDSMQTMDLSETLQDALQMVHNELKYNIQIEKHIDENCFIDGNSGQLQQVFVNLFINAKQAMEDGGMLNIELITKDNLVIATISDTGCGISEENQRKLFTPFFTTKPVGTGTGLGLSISFGILQNHHAEITVESEEGVGTKFKISFPQKTMLGESTN